MTDAALPVAGGVEQLARRFPYDFRWGVASSAYQIEGGVAEGGRGASIWDTFSHEPGRTLSGETGDVACDHHRLWAEDIGLMAELGIAAYRFSVSWPRVMPSGSGRVNQPGLDFYDRLVDGLLERGIRPMLTLYHWDLPQDLQERGGWSNPAIAEWFGDYAGLMAERLGDRVPDWLTLNEPQVFAFTGHATGRHAPGLRDWRVALQVAENALAAHAEAALRIQAASPEARVGVALNLNLVEPASHDETDVLAAERFTAINQGWFLEPLFGGSYPALAVAAHQAAGALDDVPIPPAAAPLDFLGVNYYTREVVAADELAPFGLRMVQQPDLPRTTMGWEVNPAGLRRVLHDTWQRYRPASLVVTENGAAFPDPASLDGTLPDPARADYLARHVASLAESLADGVPVEAYFAWSLLDNFEWEKGYSQRFGIVHVDYATQRRVVKASGRWYQRLIAAHRRAR